MTYLIFGGAGFIGINFVKNILKSNEKIIVYDKLTKVSNAKEILSMSSITNRVSAFIDLIIFSSWISVITITFSEILFAIEIHSRDEFSILLSFFSTITIQFTWKSLILLISQKYYLL